MRSPFALKYMEKCVDEFFKHSRRKILVWGDEDADGITSTTILYTVLKDLGYEVEYYIPRRYCEKVGLNYERLMEFMENGVRLVVTVDCGTSDYDIIKKAEKSGLRIIVTDHHELQEKIPEFIVNPKIDYEFKGLCGAAVAFKFAQAVAMRQIGINENQWLTVRKDLLPLVMIGILGDKAPLVDENREFVKLGLKEMENPKIVGLRALKEEMKIEGTKIYEILSSIIPVISAGRMCKEWNPAFDLFIIEDEEECKKRIKELKKLQETWQSMLNNAIQECISRARVCGEVLFVYTTNLPEFLIGSCAYKLAQKFKKVTVVIGRRENGILCGECRTPFVNINLLDILKENRDLFEDFGGHKLACGFSITEENVKKFRERLEKYIFKEQPKLPAEKISDIKLEDITKEFVQSVIERGPFGPGNPRPIFRTVGTAKELKERGINVNVTDENVRLEVIFTITDDGKISINSYKKIT